MEEIIWYSELVWLFNANSAGTVTSYKLGMGNANCLFLKVAVAQWMHKRS